jgi:hypothetical protein
MARTKHTKQAGVRVYEWLLCLYPRGFRAAYGSQMMQLFRDLCRDASHEPGRRARFAVWLRILPDLTSSVLREHITEQTNQMKNMPPQKVSLILFATAIAAAVLSCSFAFSQPSVAIGLAYLSALTLLMRAFAEWQRPTAEWLKGAAWGLAILVAYGFIMPVWGKVHLGVNPVVIMAPMLLNALVPLVRAGLRLSQPRA